jgi:hypothetical protein
VFAYVSLTDPYIINASIDVEVNGHPVKAFVDSGAQQTISEFVHWLPIPNPDRFSVSPECAEACGYGNNHYCLMPPVI